MKYKVSTAQLHQPIDSAGFPSKKTLSTNDVKGLTLEFDEYGLHVFNGKVWHIIPKANVAYVKVDGERDGQEG